MANFCSPKKKNNKNNKNKQLKKISCFDRKALINIATSFNNLYPIHKITIPTRFTDRVLTKFWNIIRLAIQKKTGCSDELCWLESSIGEHAKNAQSSIENYLRPLKPVEWNTSPNEWLNTLDIQAVLNQYNVYKDFLFIGAVPIDFDNKLGPGICVINELCNLNIDQLFRSGIRRIGVVFNFDSHNQSGSHWVSLFISIQKGFIAYFDSYGTFPKPEIVNFVNRVRKMMNTLYEQKPSFVKKMPIDNEITNHITKISKNVYKISKSIQKDTPLFIHTQHTYKHIKNIKLVDKQSYYELHTKTNIPETALVVQNGTFVFYNSKRYQYKNSACGMYSIIFIIELLKNKSIYEVLKDVMCGDDATEQLRDKYFRPNKK